MCINIVGGLIPILYWTSVFPLATYEKIHLEAAKWFLPHKTITPYAYVRFQPLPAVLMSVALFWDVTSRNLPLRKQRFPRNFGSYLSKYKASQSPKTVIVTHTHMQVLPTRLEHNDQRHDEAETCQLKCPHHIVIREENRLINLKLLAAPNILLMLFPLTVWLFIFLRM